MNSSIFTSVINFYLPEPHASLLNGIIFGVPLKASPTLYTDLRTVGLLHLVVLSGMNITLLATIVANLTSFLDKKFSLIISILCIIGFILFVGPAAPIIRAGIMGILALMAVAYGKRAVPLYCMLISFVIIAIFWPSWISSISLQLSYGATLGIILFGKGKTLSNDSSELNKFISSVRREFRISLTAQLFTAPIIFIHFRQISFVSPLANVLVAFTVGPLMVFGFATAILGKINFTLGLLPSYVCYAILQYIILVVGLLSKLPLANYHW